jgi:uncharacterized protein YndB with AHSA1/START domain
VRTIEAVATTSGSPAAVWALLADASTWVRWGSWSKVEVEGGGQQGRGSVRVLVRAPFRVRELITEWVPRERMAYELIDGMRVRGYRAAVTLEEAAEGGAVVRWRSTYHRAGPFTALVLRLAVRDACKRLAEGCVRVGVRRVSRPVKRHRPTAQFCRVWSCRPPRLFCFPKT